MSYLDYIGFAFSREAHLAQIHYDIHRTKKGCCCPGLNVQCPDCPRHTDTETG